MKRVLALLCMITCIFGLTACGSETVLTEYEQQKVDDVCELAADKVVGMVMDYTDEAKRAELDKYTVEEIEHILKEEYDLTVNGFAMLTAIESFDSAIDEIGSVVSVGEATAEIDGKKIIVNVAVDGEIKDAKAEIIFSNDMFMNVESAALNPVSTMGDLMLKAALNTLIGMGTVFIVLILISFIISAFALIPKIQAVFKKKDVKTTGIDNAVAQIVEKEESVDVSDDLELVAVIAAAIAAYEGSASTDGFVVRSIRKVNRGRR